MRKKIAENILVVFLAIGLVISLVGAYALYDRMRIKELPIQGTFRESESGTYIIFDSYGHFCRYSEIAGIIDDGTYQLHKDRHYVLTSSNGKLYVILISPSENGLYFFDGEKGLEFHSKVAPYLICLGPQDSEWPDWCKGPMDTVELLS